MALSEQQYLQLQQFFTQSAFATQGAVITDLDGTVIHEFNGRYGIPESIEFGLKRIYDLGRPIVLNTLRFPLSVMRTFGKEWYAISNAPIPTVLMNGSQIGYIHQENDGAFKYEELAAFPLTSLEIDEAFLIIKNILSDGIDDLLVFYYTRNWEKGETIWTPVEERIEHTKNKYLSASSVISGGVDKLQSELRSQDVCMIFLLVEVPEDRLMAYQHTKKDNFFTHAGVDKLFGSRAIASKLGFELSNSVGAGDSMMDTFLKGVGLSVHVGNPFLDFEGLVPPLKLLSPDELGEVFFTIAAMQRTIIQQNG